LAQRLTAFTEKWLPDAFELVRVFWATADHVRT
jgi:hypothetical protein